MSEVKEQQQEQQKQVAKKRKELSFDFIPITPANVKQVKVLNLALFPVRYSEKFYKDLVKEENVDMTRLAFDHGNLIGAICTRYDTHTHPDLKKYKRVYIMTLGVLAPYRNRGIATKLLNAIIEQISKQADVSDIFLHVQINNDEALQFYQKNGFSIIEMIPEYYKRIEPRQCYVLCKLTSQIPILQQMIDDYAQKNQNQSK